MSFNNTISDLHDIYIVEFYRSMDCPRSLTCYLLYSHKEHRQLVELGFDPHHYDDFEKARDSLAATKFLSKATFLDTGIDVKKQAMEGFFDAEATCSKSNERIRSGRFENASTHAILLGMSWKIANILTDFDGDELVDSANWGPGSTTLLRRSEATHPKKFSVERRITAEAYDFVKPWFHLAYPQWDVMFEISNFSKVVSVPKNAKTDRVIAIEPGINLWFQKGCGSMLRRRLRKNGIDLNDQSINQERSRIGSKFNKLATVDFSMASDTIAYALVEQVLPSNWFHLLRSFRTPSATVGGKEIHFAKFSSMGNGFTFELESLLFYAMALATCEHIGVETKGISVFGDDVILPTEAFDLFARVSHDLGFKVNVQKSYSLGNYRESCGEHHWRGLSIKPIFHKEIFNGQASVIKAANLLRTFARSRHSDGCDNRIRRNWELLVKYLGPKCPRIPNGLGDLGIIENFDETEAYRKPAGNGYEGNFVAIFAVQAVNLEFYGRGLLLSKLKALGSHGNKAINYLKAELSEGSGGNHISLPGQVRYVKKRILIPQWIDIGPWV